MDIEASVADPHADEVHPTGPDARSESPNVGALDIVHRIYGVGLCSGGPNFDGDESRPVVCQEVDLTSGNADVPIDDFEPVLAEKPRSQLLSGSAEAPAIFGQIWSSDFSNSSTFTSRKVSTWT